MDIEPFDKIARMDSSLLCVNHLVRIYKAERDGEHGEVIENDPFFYSSGSDKRLSSEKNDIKVGYWAERIESCFLEVFLRRKNDEFMPKEEHHMSLKAQAQYNITKIVLPDDAPLKLFFTTVEEQGICRSAIYSNGNEKDNFVKSVYEHPLGFDGIEYQSNHVSGDGYRCFAIFDRALKKLKTCEKKKMDLPLISCPKDIGQVCKAFPGVTFEIPSE